MSRLEDGTVVIGEASTKQKAYEALQDRLDVAWVGCPAVHVPEEQQEDIRTQFLALSCHVVFIEEAEMELAEGSGGIEVGSRVRVKRSVAEPRYGWGAVTHDKVGTVKAIDSDGDLRVDFGLTTRVKHEVYCKARNTATGKTSGFGVETNDQRAVSTDPDKRAEWCKVIARKHAGEQGWREEDVVVEIPDWNRNAVKETPH